MFYQNLFVPRWISYFGNLSEKHLEARYNKHGKGHGDRAKRNSEEMNSAFSVSLRDEIRDEEGHSRKKGYQLYGDCRSCQPVETYHFDTSPDTEQNSQDKI